MKVVKFTQLTTWQKAHRLVLDVYIAVDTFPKTEIYILTPQVLRSAISITSNIAEGFSRRSKKEKVQYYYISLGSLTELQNQLLIAVDRQYISRQSFRGIYQKTVVVQKMLNKLIKSIKES